jgi:hypothetical protein
MRDLTPEELLQLATIDPMNGKGIAAYQQMCAFQSGMEAIERMTGTTQEELSKVSEGIRKLAKPEHEEERN